MNRTLNCMGMACPLPVVNAKKAFAEFTEDGELTVQVDNETAVKNLTKLSESSGFTVSSARTGENAYEVKIQVRAETGAAKPEPKQRGVTVAVSSNAMGSGSDELGKALMKAFLFTLTTLEQLPETLVFYNSGAFLTCEGSDSLQDLSKLEESGVKIITCGTCLNYYELTEKLRVGSVSNMYDIVETLAGAASVIRP